MKKLLAILVVFGFLAGSMVGCGDTKKTEKTTSKTEKTEKTEKAP